MLCDDIRERLDELWEGEATAEIRQHLARCRACAEYYRGLRLVRSGLRLWKQDEGPAPSLGFAERLVRQLGALSKAPSVTEFFERVGRRFVYATLVLTFVALLALMLPATGPVRGLTAADIQISSSETLLAYSDPIGETGMQESPDLAPPNASAPDGTKEVK
jgi:hypothetical protein